VLIHLGLDRSLAGIPAADDWITQSSAIYILPAMGSNSNRSPRGVVAFPTVGNRGWCCLWRDGEGRVHAQLIVAWQVADQHVVSRPELERQVSTLARRDVAFFAH
jgi:hypothetical protein